MNTTNILPVIDLEVLQQKANEFAQKGSEETLKEFYTGYNSPYKKAIEEQLKSKVIDDSISIPDIIGRINEGISHQVDLMANEAIAKTFLPMVQKFLTRAEPENKFSEILKEFIELTDFNYNDSHKSDYTVNITDGLIGSSFIKIEINTSKHSYSIRLHCLKDKSKKVYQLYTLPEFKEKGASYSNHSIPQMKLLVDGVSLEMPFTPNVLNNPVMSYLSKFIIAQTQITMDITDFEDDMFGNEDDDY